MISRKKAIVTASLAFALGIGGIPAAVYAEEPAIAAPTTLDEAWQTYGELSMQVAEVGESLNDTYFRLEQNEASKADLLVQIEASTARLEAARVALADRVSANYKAGSGSLLDIILSTDSFESLVSALHYVDKLTDADVAAVEEVKQASEQLESERASLEATQKELEDLAGQKEQQLKDLKASLDKQKGYIESLSAPLKAAFDERQITEIVEQQAKAVEALAAQEALLAEAAQQAGAQTPSGNAQGTATAPAVDGAGVASAVTTIAQETAQAATSQGSQSSPAASSSTSAPSVSESTSSSSGGSSSSYSGTSGLSSDARAAILEAAYSQIGVSYVYGASSPGQAFDCSGLTSWAYAQAGIDIPHSSVGQSQMATNVSSADELQPGDLVFYIGNVGASQSGSHVAIYAGNGEVIHANGSQVVVSEMNDSWTSAGSIGLDY